MHQLFIPAPEAGCGNSVEPVQNTLLRALALIVITLLFCSGGRLALAQAIYGSISGTVTDASGAAVPNATVTVTDIAKGTTKTVQSNSGGFYTVDQLIPDTYSVEATATNFTPAKANSVTVAADTTQTVNLQVNVGGANQTVTVTSEAPALKTDRADVGQVLGERQLQNLPNLNRNFTSFALLTPGVQRSSFNIAPTENPQGTTALNANGSNYGTLGYVLDGTDNREPVDGIIVINPTLDSISEMKVDTQNFPAEFGGSVGGVVTAQTRSGGNAFHGDAFFYRRSDALAARNPFTNFQRDPVTGRFLPSALYSQFGGSVGGPIRKNRAFFFLDYQGTRQKVGTSLQQNVPTATVRNTCLNAASATCDLSQYGSGVISNALVTPQGRALLSAFPQPNAGAAGAITNNYIASGSGNNDGDLADTRLDYQVTSTVHAFGRYDYANFRLFGAPALGAAGGQGFGIGNTTGTDQVQNQSVSVGFDWAIHANLLTDFRFGFLDYHVVENKFDVGTAPATAAGLPNLNTGALDTSGSPTFNVVDNSISPFGTQGCNCPLQESEQVFQLVNNWTKIVGNHSFKFGADIRYALNLRNASDSNRSGQLSFNNTTGAGSGIGAVLTGQIAQFQRFDVYNNNAANRQKRGGFYAQDTWRVTPKLTLDYGVRWDII
ncbi:MAG TPA: carboxypeptidase regulatory-like domain-containing protein, partial [Acidobacteriaceae bacterium]|nr:carboxypeptidase regulatory-like domain-containing protein [Acidobacteriaceae bacterium]